MKNLYEILVPTISNEGKPFRTKFHRVWDDKVRKISNGLTIVAPVKGQWVNEENIYSERMIPVRIFATDEQINQIADMTAKYYNQLAIMFYMISNNVQIKHYD